MVLMCGHYNMYFSTFLQVYLSDIFCEEIITEQYTDLYNLVQVNEIVQTQYIPYNRILSDVPLPTGRNNAKFKAHNASVYKKKKKKCKTFSRIFL